MQIKLKDFVPPIVRKVARRMGSSKQDQSDIFEGNGLLFKKALANCSSYGEYGMGASTRWVLENTNAKVSAVDTSKVWVDHVVTSNSAPDRLHAQWVDVGPVGDWGRPLSYANRSAFSVYADAIWQDARKHEVVLIDGRLRVNCFLHALLVSDPGTSIIFDDYTNRPHYHVVEEIVSRTEEYGRQALFVTPPNFDRDKASYLREAFRYVLD